MATATRARTLWSCAALLVGVVATLAADRPDDASAGPAAPFVPVTCWSENFDGVTASALPVGWATVKLSGATNPWGTVATTADTPPNRAVTGNPSVISDNYLLSPFITIPPGASTLAFRNSYNTEANFDGGVLEISISAGAYADIISAGGSFVGGGYNATIGGSSGSPITGRQAWSGNSGGFITTTVNLPPSAANQTVRLRWRMASDASTGGTGWSIDTATIAADTCGAGPGPGSFSKVFPEDTGGIGTPGANIVQPHNLTLQWAASSGATSYEYCIFTGNESQCLANSPNWINTGTNTSAPVTNLTPSVQYWWHVRANGPGGTTYSNNSTSIFPSGYWRFNSAPPLPGPITRLLPLSGATNRPRSLALTWSGGSGSSSQQYCIDTIDDGTCNTSWVTAQNQTATFTALNPSTTYWWHIRANNNAGTTYAGGDPSAFIPFTTAPASKLPFVDFDGDGLGDVFTQDLPTGVFSLQRYQQGGGFLENTGNQGVQVYSQTMKYDTDARTDVGRFNVNTGDWRLWMNSYPSPPYFSQANTFGSWWTGWQRHVMDLNGDTNTDFFLYDPATGFWFQCVPTGCHQGGWNPGWEVYPARLNNDAIGDVFLFNRQTGRWFWALGTGAGSYSFTYPVTETWFSGWQIYPGDFNGDGLTDFLLHDPNTGTYFVAFTGASGFTYGQGGWSLGWTPIIADLNGDGKDDVFRHDSSTGNWTWMIGDGAGAFTKSGNMGTWSLGWQIYPTDFDGDGKADFFLYHSGSGVWYQARNSGPGTFAYTNGFWKAGLMISSGTIGR